MAFLDLGKSSRCAKTELIEFDQQDVNGNIVFQDRAYHGVFGAFDIQLQQRQARVSVLRAETSRSRRVGTSI